MRHLFSRGIRRGASRAVGRRTSHGRRRQPGQALAEYALILATVFVLAIGGLKLIAGPAVETLNHISSELQSAFTFDLPGATPHPTVSPKPTKTPKPGPTPKPTKTPKPAPTPKPTKTPKPAPTPKPTKPPKATKAPKAPKAPKVATAPTR